MLRIHEGLVRLSSEQEKTLVGDEVRSVYEVTEAIFERFRI